MRVAALLLLVAACRSDGTSGTLARIQLLAGDQPAPGIQVLAHTPAGDVTSEDVSDAVGVAKIEVDEDSLITARFGGSREWRITTLPPAADATLELHGPARAQAVLVVGVLDVGAPALAGATGYDIDVGCVTLHVTQLPTSIDIGACSEGHDTLLDVLVTAHDASTVLGYGAGRVPLLDGVAAFEVSAWATPAAIPVDVGGTGATVTTTYYADGNAYDAATPVVYPGLEAERTRITATSGTRRTERFLAGVPEAITFAAMDFLPQLSTTLTSNGSRIAWEPPGFGDAVHLALSNDAVAWDVVLPPDAGSVVLPLELDLTSASTTLQAIDSTDLADFAGLQAVGVYAQAVVPPPLSGDIRTTTSP